jgi:site-specific DNA-cytosine methylase
MTDTTQKFTWAPLVPLIGGFPVGIESAFGTAPEAIYSFPGIGNDEHYVNYQQNTLGRKDVKFVTFPPEDTSFIQKINLIVCTPPCAGLSSLNTSKNPLKQGHTGEQNQAMYDCLKSAITKFDADMIAIENAPALATKKGVIVADKLRAIAKEY